MVDHVLKFKFRAFSILNYPLLSIVRLKIQWIKSDNTLTESIIDKKYKNKMPPILALRVMLGLIHLFELYASPIDKTILANGIV